MTDPLVKQIIWLALPEGDLADAELPKRAQCCFSAAIAILTAIEDDDVFEQAIAEWEAGAQETMRRSRAAISQALEVADTHEDIAAVAKALLNKRRH